MKVVKKHDYLGFTIVELLVVIVVIAILATITIVSFTGISQKAVVTSLQSDLSSAKKQLALYYVDHGYYPTIINTGTGNDNCPTPNDLKYCLKPSSDTQLYYAPNNNTSPTGFSLTAKKNSISYKVTDNTSPTIGDNSTYGLVGHWALDNVTGITDLSTFGNNGTAYGSMTIGGATGHLGTANKATTFDGSNDYVSVSNSTSLTFGTSDFSISYWMKLNSTADPNRYAVPFDSGYSAGKGMLLEFDSGTICRLYIGTTLVKTWTVTQILNNWHHFILSRSGSVVSFYVDSNKIGTDVTNNTNILNHSTLLIGKYGGGEFVNGLIDDFCIYNRAFSQSEIIQLYTLN